MVLTLPVRGNFGIRARRKGFGCNLGFVLPLKARVGRTCEALALFLAISAILLLPFPRNSVVEMKQGSGGHFCPCALNVWRHMTIFPGRTGSGMKIMNVIQTEFFVVLRTTSYSVYFLRTYHKII
jgi:hypothetical protein